MITVVVENDLFLFLGLLKLLIAEVREEPFGSTVSAPFFAQTLPSLVALTTCRGLVRRGPLS